MAAEGRNELRHIAALDGARGAAVAGVLLFHGGHLVGGYLGVDFFFVLSGFLITSLLLAETRRTGSIGLGGFWARRARRLLPALGVLMVGIAVYCATIAAPDQLAKIRGDAFATLGYVANWRQIFSHQDYFALFSAPSPLNHTWSLSIEEQFYVLWPLVVVGLLLMFRRRTPVAVLSVALVLAGVASALTMVLYQPADVAASYYGTETRVAAILFGAALAAWLAMRGPARTRRAYLAVQALGIAGLVVLVIAWTHMDGQSATPYRGGLLVCGLAATAVIAAAVHATPGPASRLLSLRPLCALGLISYGVYLYHWPIDLVLDQERTGLSGWPLFLVQTVVTVAIAVASYRLIEQPIRRGAWTPLQWRALTPALGIVLVVAIVATTRGAQEPAIAATPAPAPASQPAASLAGGKRVMIVGDSVAYDLAESMKTVAVTPPVSVLNATLIGCVFPSEITAARYGDTVRSHTVGCDRVWDLKAVPIGKFRADVVLWVTNGPASAVMYRGKWLDTCAPRYASLYERSLRKEAARLKLQSPNVAITTEANPRYRSAAVDAPTRCENRIRRKVASALGLHLVDLHGYICPRDHCRTHEKGVVLRPDGEHFQGPGGQIVARWLLDQATGNSPLR